MRVTQLKSGTRIENVTRIPVTIHTLPGWPAFAGHDIIRVSIQGRWYYMFFCHRPFHARDLISFILKNGLPGQAGQRH
jgi:hypothetical protein